MMDIEKIKKECDDLTKKLSDPELINSAEKLEELSKRYAILKKVIEKSEEIEKIKKNILENEEIIKAKEDIDLVNLAEQDLSNLIPKKDSKELELEGLIKGDGNGQGKGGPPDGARLAKGGPAIVEIRAGTGGEEAALFAGDLFRMYSKYAQKIGWNINILSSHQSNLGGLKEIIFEVKNENAFSKMQYESGVHRIQRIPETEKSGRTHTSAATVAVLPKPSSWQMKINSQDLKIEAFRASGPGGQLVNRRESAVRVTHLPTGITVSSQQARTQVQNKEYALNILRARVLAMKMEEEAKKTSEARKKQIGTGDRSEKIRTYNFPQDRITDHRIKKSWHHIERIMDGDLDKIINELQKQLNNNK